MSELAIEVDADYDTSLDVIYRALCFVMEKRAQNWTITVPEEADYIRACLLELQLQRMQSALAR